MTTAQLLTDLAMAMSYDDVVTLMEHSPRLRASFDMNAWTALYTPSGSLPETLLMPLVNHAMAPSKGALWRGPMDTGAFTLETPDRAYVLHGHVQGGELAGKVTVVTEDMIVHGLYNRGVPDGVWHTDHAFTTSLLSTETYVDGLRQGASMYYYDLPKGVTAEGGGSKRYELDYVNDTPVAWRLFRPDGSVEKLGKVVDGTMVHAG
jgi:hypothetical protein